MSKLKDKVLNINKIEDLQKLKDEILGKNGYFQKLTNEIKQETDNEIKKNKFQELNTEKNNISKIIKDKEEELNLILLEEKMKAQEIDIQIDIQTKHFDNNSKIKSNLNLINKNQGSIHILSDIINDISSFFIKQGYEIKYAPEIESEEINFEKLNIKKDHPARDMQDSFYIEDEFLLRTHTSNTQIREMIKNKDNIKMISFGDVFRKDEDDATHSHQFMQLEGLVISRNVSLANLKHTINEMLKYLFGEKIKTRLRPSYFPFTEPSIEVDMTCFNCQGSGCAICKKTGFIEILGAGMVDPNVLRNCGIDPDKKQGFAFGLGIDRIAMIKYGIDDIRTFYKNDINFLRKYKG